jgi:hypothetical protein
MNFSPHDSWKFLIMVSQNYIMCYAVKGIMSFEVFASYLKIIS